MMRTTPRRFARADAVAADRHEIDRVRNVDGAHEIGQKQHAAFQNAHQHQFLAGVIRFDLLAQLGNARLQFRRIDQHIFRR